MNNRWHMNRLGFVNFWLYDEETFSLSDGKLLLRGQNASGKSITTQSFIPFILDGDRTPSRLDPFGSSDRKMDYYFLGDGEKDESTGYLFLEFKRENVEQYRTIGIGQRAQKGKPMSFWGFIVLDGKRISYDLQLYKEVGTNKIPLTKKELKETLGDENLYTESQREYMELVNKHIFGFPNLEQYNQFIKLLIKVRAPKLSKEFKPTKVYEILNDSLQTLSDEDMRAMVEAMEKMDDIQERLDHLKSAFKDAQIIRKEYHRYNLYMLGKKAQIYLDEKKKVDAERKNLEGKEEERQDKSRQICELKEREQALTDEEQLLKREKEVLHIEDLEVSVERLREAHKAHEEALKDKKAIEDKIENSREKILLYDGRLREYTGNIELYQSEAAEYVESLQEKNELLQVAQHSIVKKLADSLDCTHDILELNSAIRELEKAARQGQEALKERQEKQSQWDKEEEKLQKLTIDLEYAQEQCQDAENLENECRDKLIEQFYILQAENREMGIARDELEQITQNIQKYKEPGDFAEIRDMYFSIWKEKNDAITSQKLKKDNERDCKQQEKEELEEELADIQNMEMPTPEHSLRTEEARNRLREKGIPFLPFYEAVEFADHLPQELKDRIECQLQAAGLLDALVVPENEKERARGELKELSDVLIRSLGKGGECYPYLRVDQDVEEDIKEEAQRILHHICLKEQQAADVVLGEDGYFRNGILEGYSHAAEEAAFVGAAARKRTKERMIQQKQEELRQKEEELSVLDAEIQQIVIKLADLRQEFDRFPPFDDLNRAMDLLRSSRNECERYRKLFEEQEQKTRRAQEQYKQAEQRVIRICKPLPYLRKPEAYQEVIEAAENYRDDLGKLEGVLARLENEKNQYAHTEELIQGEEEARESAYEYLRRANRMQNETQIQVKRLEDYLNNPEIKEAAERLKQIKERLEEIREENQKNGNRLAVLEDNVNNLGNEIEEWKLRITEQIGKENKTRQYFIEELSLGLIMKQEGDSPYETALKAHTLIREGDRQRSGIEMTTSLMKIFQSHLASLSSYGIAIEECFANEDSFLLRSRQRIAAIWNGQKLYLEDFYTILKESIDNTELLIQQKDRELFEGILADTLSRKLSSRIKESRSWIEDMSKLMKGMDTSMALTFSLDWRARAAEGENELDTRELEKILARDKELLTDEDIEKVSFHFRNKIHTAKQIAQENGEIVNYMDLVRDALDYRKWFTFHMNYYRNNENRKELTNGAFNRFSGGEKAMAMYVPLFAAVTAQYKKAASQDHPRIIALDEAFAGVDDKNISSMFELVQKLDFDYIMNSQVLWGCYETVKNLRIAELIRPSNSDVITVIFYHWNGRKRVLDEQ